ncbi:MAG TPA: hypothetical protein VHL53_07170 [Acidimicrobiia bacterium]|nr:hypothetical protein [Acidimicrobiia bacterium]
MPKLSRALAHRAVDYPESMSRPERGPITITLPFDDDAAGDR